MHARSTSVLVVAAIACAPVTVALAQRTQAAPATTNQQRQNQSQTQTQGQSSQSKGRLSVPVTAIVATAGGAVAATATVNGSFSIQRFARTTDNGVAAVGILTLSVTDSTSEASRAIITRTALPVTTAPQTATAVATQTCQGLSLVLGSVDIDPVGLAVHTNELTVDLAALQTTSDQRFTTVLCQAAGMIESARPADLVTALNTLLEML